MIIGGPNSGAISAARVHHSWKFPIPIPPPLLHLPTRRPRPAAACRAAPPAPPWPGLPPSTPMSPPPPPAPAPAPRAVAHRVLPCNRRRRRSTSRIGHRRPRRHGRPGFLLPPLPRAPMLSWRGAQLGRRAREREEALAWTPEGRGEAVVVRRPEQKTKGVELSGRRRRARRRVGLNAAPRGSSACTPERLGGADQYPGYGGGGGGGGIPPRRPQGSARVGPGARAARGAHLGRRIRRSSHVGPIQRTRCARSGRRRKLWVGFTTFCAPPPLACKALAPLTHFCFATTTIFTSHKRSGIAER